MVVLVLLGLIITPLLLVAATFLLGYRLGGESFQQQLLDAKLQAAEAERQVYQLTRQAFMQMAEHAERKRREGTG